MGSTDFNLQYSIEKAKQKKVTFCKYWWPLQRVFEFIYNIGGSVSAELLRLSVMAHPNWSAASGLQKSFPLSV